MIHAHAKRQIPRHLSFFILLCDILALFAAFVVTKYISVVLTTLPEILGWNIDLHDFDMRRFYYLFICFFILLRFLLKGHYSRRMPWLGQVESIIKTIGFAAIFDCFNFYLLKNPGFPYLILLNWGLCILLVLLARQVSIFIVSHSKRWRLPIALVGDSRMIMDCFYAFYSDGLTGYEVKVVLLTGSDDPDFDLSFVPKAHPYVELRKDTESFDRFVQENTQYYYIFGMDELRGKNKDRMTKALNLSQVEYAVIPNTKSLDVHGMEPHYFFGNDIMILHRRDSIRSPSGRLSKRLLDIGVTGIFLPFLGLLTFLVIVAKKIEGSKSPVFYGGKRVGMDGELFNCWKFCTMKQDGDAILRDLLARDEHARMEWSKFQKLKNDPRIDSRISKFLRKTSLDELPQIWNVFHGDMSLVGPRPILERQVAEYGDLIEQYYAVRPGLTGLWQVSGRNETSFQQRVSWDGWYIRNWSLWYDFVIMFKTVRVLLTGSGAY